MKLKWNKARLLELADIIEAQPHSDVTDEKGFCMAVWTHPCGTPSCIAGFAASLYWKHYGEPAGPGRRTAWTAAAAWLTGIAVERVNADTREGTYVLFIPKTARRSLTEITPQEAALTLRKLAETGKIDWSHA